jgi:hypothetical protein
MPPEVERGPFGKQQGVQVCYRRAGDECRQEDDDPLLFIYLLNHLNSAAIVKPGFPLASFDRRAPRTMHLRRVEVLANFFAAQTPRH